METSTSSNQQQILKKKFKNGFIWNFVGSIIYESLKTIHHFFLLQFLHVSMYGLMGSMFAVIYFTTKLADVGTTYTLPPFFYLFIKSKHSFRTLFFRYFLVPQIPIILLSAILATYFYRHQFLTTQASSYIFIIPILIILETVRPFFRYLLHFSFQSKTIVLIELISFFTYLVSIWFFFFGFKYSFSLNLIFLPHIIESGAVVLIFSYLLYSLYQKLPTHKVPLPTRLWKRIFNIRIFNYFLRVSREVFTSHFITPLFALKFGLQEAGLFFFAGALGTSLQSIIKVSIGYSGNALLANLKESTQETKKEAFYLLSEKLMKIVAPLVIFLLINHQAIIRLGNAKTQLGLTLSLLLLFLIIIFTEFFFLLYEQFYVIEEASQKLFIFKLFEFALLYTLVLASNDLTPVATLVRIVIIRLLSFAVITINAYYIWKIKPNFKTNLNYLLGCVTLSIIASFFFK